MQKSFEQLFCTYNLGFVFFCQKEIGAKATCKMLVKLTEGYKANFALKRQKFGQTFLLVLLLQFRSRYILL